MSPATPSRATVADLDRVQDKAELIGGRIVIVVPTGFLPSQVSGRNDQALADHGRKARIGVALRDGAGFVVPELSSGRESFSPDAACCIGPTPANLMDCVSGPPALAVELRSKGDYGPALERKMAAKQADDFETGTLIF